MSAPTIQGVEDFGHGVVGVPPYANVFGTPSIVTSPSYPYTAGKTLKILTSGGNEGVRYNISGTPTRGWMGFAWLATTPVGTGVVIGNFGVVSGNSPRIAMNASQQLYSYFTGAGPASAPTITVTLDTWHWIEMIFNASGTTYTCYWQYDGVDQEPSTKTTEPGSTVSYSQLLSFSGDPSGVSNYYGLWKWGTANADNDWHGIPPEAELQAGSTIPFWS